MQEWSCVEDCEFNSAICEGNRQLCGGFWRAVAGVAQDPTRFIYGIAYLLRTRAVAWARNCGDNFHRLSHAMFLKPAVAQVVSRKCCLESLTKSVAMDL